MAKEVETTTMMVKKTVRLPQSLAQEVEIKPRPTEYMRQAIETQVEREKKTKISIGIIVEFANTGSYSSTIRVNFSLKGSTSFREQISEFIQAVENLQKAITRLDP